MKRLFIFILLIPLVQFPCLAATDDSWEKDDAWLVFIAQHQDLYDEVEPFVRSMRWSDAISTKEIRMWQKLRREKTAIEKNIMDRMHAHLRKHMRFDDPSLGAVFSTDMDEIVVIGRMFDQFPIDPAEFSYTDILGMRGTRMTANELYADGKYEEAYPLLLDLAKRGFKDSQSRLAYILFNGTENIEKSNLRALGWLGTAAHGESEPIFRVLFKRYMAQVPESVRRTVDAVLDGYREQFDSSAYMDCTTNHPFTHERHNSSVVKRTYCQFDLEAKVKACEAGKYGGACWAHAANTQVD